MSWQIEGGRAGETPLSGLRVILAHSHDDDEPGTPWSVLLYLPDRADTAQRDALEQIFLGRLGGAPAKRFPWAAHPAHLLGVRTIGIDLDHDRGDGWFRAGRIVSVSISGPVADQAAVTSDITGLDQAGRELHSEQIWVEDDGLSFGVRDRCGFESEFEYWSAGA